MNDIDFFSYGLRLLGRREYSVLKLRNKLLKRFPENVEEVEAALVLLKEKQFLSNDRFCRAYIQDQILKKNGPQKILMKLRIEGIEDVMSLKYIDEGYPLDLQQEIKEYLWERKECELRRKTLSEAEKNYKIRQYLYQKGFYL